MNPTRRLAILAKAATSQGVAAGYQGLTHHEAVTVMQGLIARRTNYRPQPNGMYCMTVRYYLTSEGERYLAVMQPKELSQCPPPSPSH